MTLKYCRVCGPVKPKIDDQFHDVDNWPSECYAHFGSTADRAGPQIVKDIDPYKTAAADVNGKQVRIEGRRQHREFLKRNGYQEIGNEAFKQRAPQIDTVKGHEIRSVIERLNRR